MLRKWSALVLLLLGLPVLAFAQNTGKLAGTITDASTGEPLPGATVVLQGTTLGTAADVEGNYFIIGVPVGSYDVQASFVGYQTSTVEGVEISSGYTRELNFELSPGVELDEIVVEYERPLIQKDAIGAPRVVTGEDILNLPVRGIANVAAIQSGVVANEGSSNLYIRGGREQEVQYYVDGVKVIGLVGVPQSSIQEQEMLIGTIPARYGDAQAGIISITTKSGIGSQFFGSAEFVTSEALDDFGYNLGSLSVGGPIVPQRLSFFLSAEGRRVADDNPFARETFTLSDNAFDNLQQAPQAIRIEDGTGASEFVPLPGDLFAEGMTREEVEAALAEGGMLPEGFHTVGAPVNAAELLIADDFSRTTGKHSPSRSLSTQGNLTFQPTQATSLRLGGAVNLDDDETYNYARSLYASDRFYETERQTWRASGTWRHYLSNSTFYEINADFSTDKFWQHPNGFSKDVRDALFYSDVDGVDANGNQTIAHDIFAPARRYWDFGDEGLEPKYSDGNTPSGGGVYGLFALPGTSLTRYIKFDNQQFRLSANATTQVGVHQIEFGGEFEQRTNRYYDIAAGGLARYFNDGNVEAGAGNAVSSYEELPYSVVGSLIVGGNWYGYDYLGLEETDDEDIDAFAAGENRNTAPWQPIYYGGYIQDKIEFRDLVINLGLRVDVFDNNTQVLIDPFATEPLIRAGSIGSRPAAIGDDFAVYYADGNSNNAVVGYRDAEGNYYDAEGARTTFTDLNNLGKPVVDSSQPISAAFEDYEPQVTFMPRIGVSFPVTDQALFFASYNVLAQRPTENAYMAPVYWSEISGGSTFANPALKPEVTTQYELGFRQRVGARAALQISGFYRTQKNKIGRRTLNGAFPVPGYYGNYNVDFTTTKGASFEFDLRRTNNVAVNANYTLSFAQGTGSDAATAATIAWRGNYFPDFITPAAFDRRHSINVSLDYRFGEGEGPMIGGARLLQNFGVNVLAVVQSGLPYTQLQAPVTTPIFNQTNNYIVGGINEARMPWNNRIDLRVDRRFLLGSATSLTAFLTVENLLDNDNVFGVYRGSGLPDSDGFLAGGSANTELESATDPDAYIFHYDTFVANPTGAGGGSFAGFQAYGVPRQTRLGIRLDF